MKRLLFFIFALTISISAQEKTMMKHKLENVVVTAGRTAVEFSDLTRNVEIISADQIKATPVNDIQDLLQYAAGVDLKQRGIDGVQADVGIRGGSFEQTLILINGVKVSDPQTGHHNLNIPFSINDIERIEVLKGQGSRVHGPNAFSGVINIITKKGSFNELKVNAIGGENGYYSTSVSAAYPTKYLKSRISFNRKKADGYVHNTDFLNTNYSYNGSVNLKNINFDILAGYTDKEFGANKFYSSRFPDQWEHTKTTFINLNTSYIKDGFTLEPKLYYRKNNDDYILIKDHPEIYENIHESKTYGADIQAAFNYDLGSTAFGAEFIQDKIESSNLGNHSREKKGFFAEQTLKASDDLTLVTGFFAYDYANIGWKFWPGFEFAYKLSSPSKIYGSVGKAFRLPSYTELYYSSPTNKGNENLEYEETLNFELGYAFTSNYFRLNTSLFRKEGKNIIDWAKAKDESVWQARNINEINTNGFEMEFNFTLNKLLKQKIVKNLKISYTYLDADKSSGNIDSRYILDFLKHQFVARVNNALPFDVEQSWTLRYEDRINFEDSFIVDTQISKRFETFDVFLRATNLFDRDYRDISGVDLPGRWVTAGINLNLANMIF